MPAGRFKPRELLAEVGLAESKSQAERLLRQRAVKRDGVVLEPGAEVEVPAVGASLVLSVGSSRFVRVEGPPGRNASRPAVQGRRERAGPRPGLDILR